MFVARVFQDRHRRLEEIRFNVGVRAKFTTRVAQKKFCVFLVSQAISGNMLGLQRDRFLKRCSPLFSRLSGKPKHKIDIDI